jgi:4-hydroxythreonine-4-phosphate dehydrogenase
MIRNSGRSCASVSRRIVWSKRLFGSCASVLWLNTASSLRLAITLGDPRGIGPEVTVAATRKLRAETGAQFIFIGPEASPTAPFADQYIAVGNYTPGDARSAGAVAGQAIEKAIELASRGDVAAIITAPIDKSALHAGGYNYPGHTEMLAALTRTPAVVMMLTAETTSLGAPLRVVLATTHMPLKQVPAALNSELLVEQTCITQAALQKQWRIDNPRIALCAINPHASDGGLFGDEEQRIYQPAIRQLQAIGVRVTQPLPADTVFLRAARGEFDVVIAPYHDVGMAAFKTAAFGHGVNVTLGLPFVRTSPDHGTALDIAGTGVADSSSMEEAIKLAIRLAQ